MIMAAAEAPGLLPVLPSVMVMQPANQSQPAPVSVWVVDALEKVLRTATPPAPATEELTLEAARNEYESGQLVVRSPHAITDLRASVGPLQGPGGAQIAFPHCRCRFVGYVGVEKNTPATPPEELVAVAPVELPDVLLEDETITVPANTAQPIWLTVYVPAEAPAGEYRGAVQLSWAGGERQVPVRLTVWPFTVPQERHLYFTNWISAGHLAKRYKVEAYSEAFWGLFEKFVANAAAHRQNLMWVSPYLIRVFREADGQLTFDFALFDRWIEICARHGVADLIEISHLGGFKEGWGGREIGLHPWNVTDRASGQTQRRPAEEVLPKLLPALQEHLQRRGWLAKTVLHIADEPSVNNLQSWRAKSDWVHALAPRIRRIEAIEAPDFGDSLEIWVPKLSHYYHWQQAYEKARQRGAELWFYTCCHPMGRYPNRFVDYPLIKTRILHWLNWRYRLSGYLHWGLLCWTDDPFKSAISGGLPPGDAWIVYPGSSGPLDSLRWETLRDGLEDYEYLWLLTAQATRLKAELGPAAADFEPTQLADELCCQAASGVLDYVRDPARLRALRRQLAREIIAAYAPPRLLVWTQPPASHPLAAGPAVAVLYVAAEPGTQVTVNGKEVELDERGRHAQNLFLSPGHHEIVVTASRQGHTKTVTRLLSVTQ
jgi:hypothetical protein